MLRLILIVGLFLPHFASSASAQSPAQNPAQSRPLGRAATRSLPIDKTLMAIELPGVKRLLELGDELPVLALWKHPKFQGFLRFGAGNDPAWRAFYDRRSDWMTWLERFDRGLAASSVFTKAYSPTRPQPFLYFTGASSDGARLRGFDSDVRAMVAAARKAARRDPVAEGRLGVPDMPIEISTLSTTNDYGGSNMRLAQYFVRKGRVAAAYGSRQWIGDDRTSETYDAAIAEALGAVVGASGRQPDAMSFGTPPAIKEREAILARGMLRFARNVEADANGLPERSKREMRNAGFWHWDGMTSMLARGPKGFREVVESHNERVEGDSPFRFLNGDAYGLGDAAESLPTDAFAAMRIAFDDEMFTRWITKVGEDVRASDELREFFTVFRRVLALDPPAAEHGMKGVSEITVAILPPAPGVLAPEFCLLLRIEGDAQQPRALLTELAKIAAPLMGAALPVKTLGKGDDAIPYVSIKDMFQTRSGGGMRSMNEQSMIAKAMLGGGFVSATRVGPYLAIGCNPRTIRKLRRSVTKGETLAKRAGFAQQFEKGSGSFFEAWFDWKSIVRSARIVDQATPLLFATMSVRRPRQLVAVAVADGDEVEAVLEEAAPAQAEKPAPLVLPTTADIAALVGEQRFRGTETDFGHRIEIDGSLVLSPLSICAWIAAYELHEQATLLNGR